MRKKTAILTVFVLFLAGILMGVFSIMKERGLLFQEKIKHAMIEDKLNLSTTKNPLLACLFKINNDEEYWCYNKKGFGFLETNILDSYSNIRDFDKGLVFIQPKGNILEEYDVDIDSIYSKWYEEIKGNEQIFTIKESEYTLIDFYSFMKWQQLKVRTGEINESGFGNKLESLKQLQIFSMFPMSRESLDYICKMVPEYCDYWRRYNEDTVSDIIKSYNINGDFTDKKETYSILRMYIIGTSSSGNINLPSNEYLEFITKIKENDDSMTDEKIDFLGKYFFRDYFDYSDELYDSWKNDKEHYYKFLDLVCNIDICVNIKLNILFDEYKI